MRKRVAGRGVGPGRPRGYSHATRTLREAADYDAVMVSPDEGERIVGLAGRFVTAVASMLEQ